MKRILPGLIAMLAALSSLQAQGTVNFANFGPGWLTSRFSDAFWQPLNGTFSVELLAGTTVDGLLSVAIATPSFVNGYFDAGVVTVPVTGNGFAQVHVWDNMGGTITSYNQATLTANVPFSQTIVFAISGLEAPPAPPVTMFNMPGTVFSVPESSTPVLGLLGGLAVFLFRRRR